MLPFASSQCPVCFCQVWHVSEKQPSSLVHPGEPLLKWRILSTEFVPLVFEMLLIQQNQSMRLSWIRYMVQRDSSEDCHCSYSERLKYKGLFPVRITTIIVKMPVFMVPLTMLTHYILSFSKTWRISFSKANGDS